MNAGAVYDFSKDTVVISQLAVVRKMWSTPGGCHEQRLILLAPMFVMCSDRVAPFVVAAIEESERRGAYE